MTTLREAAQQALEALENSRVFVTTREKIKHPEGTEWYDETITALRAALAQQDKCEWVQDGYEESDTWQASCSGRYFMLEDGTPKDNHMTHCCYCGKTLSEVPFEQDDSDE